MNRVNVATEEGISLVHWVYSKFGISPGRSILRLALDEPDFWNIIASKNRTPGKVTEWLDKNNYILA